MSADARSGRLFGVGVGPGDPELITVKAQRVLRQAQVIAYPCARHGHSNARSIVCSELIHGQIELPMMLPIINVAVLFGVIFTFWKNASEPTAGAMMPVALA